MRKRNHRIPRPLALPLTAIQHQDLVLRPRISLELLCRGDADMEHLQVVLGFFNLGLALVFLSGNHGWLPYFEDAQTKVSAAECQPSGHFHLLPGPDLDSVVALFNALDEFLPQQYQHMVVRAIDCVKRALHGEVKSVDVLTLRKLISRCADR